MKAAVAILASIALIAFASSASGAPPMREAPDWAFRSGAGEAVLGAVSVASLAAGLLPQRFSPSPPSIQRPYDEDADAASDLTGDGIGALLQTTNGYFFEGAYLGTGDVTEPYLEALRVPLIDAEAVALTNGIIVALKRMVGRCRPRDWVGDHCRATVSAHEGFPSGHTGPIGAIAGVHFALAARTSEAPAFRWTPFAIAETGAIGTAFLRVAAGAHTWEDVSVGWAIGHAVGLLVSFAHPFRAVPGKGAGTAKAPLSIGWSATF